MTNKVKNNITAILISVLMVFAMMPAAGAGAYEAYADYEDYEDPGMVMGAGILAKNVNTAEAQILLYGGREWYVIAYDGVGADGNMITYTNPVGGTENLYEDGVVTLLQSDVHEHETSAFSDPGEDGNKEGFQGYGTNCEGEPSILRQSIESIYLNGDGERPALFNQREKDAISARHLPGYGYLWSSYTDQDAYDSNRINNNDLEDALVWPLSHAEADKVDPAIRALESKDYWLRSSGFIDWRNIMNGYGALVNENGETVLDHYKPSEVHGVRPAFYLDESAVLFTSAAFGGKESGGTGASSLKWVGNNSSDKWKLTLKDASHDGFRIVSVPSQMDCPQELTLQYSGAATGTNEYISAVICNADGDIKYYGRLKKCSNDFDASGEVRVKLKGLYNAGDKLYVFSEQANGDELTDYASGLREITVPAVRHDLEKTEAKDATCTDPGNTEYWTCNMCGSVFADGNAEEQIYGNSWVIPAKGHKEILNHNNKRPATLEADGWIEVRCDNCGSLLGIRDIFSPKDFSLSPVEFTYNGKKKTPSVTVTDVNGQVIPADNYSVLYSNNTNAGTATVDITFNGDLYSGSKTLTFKINKAANPLTVKAKTAKVKAKKLKKKNQTLAVSKVMTVGNGQGPVSYKLVSVSESKYKKYFKVNAKTGKVTVKKKLKKGTYKLKINVTAAGNGNYNKATKTVTVIIKVK